MYACLRALRRGLTALLTQEEGQGLAEYALILVLMALVAIAALTFLGGGVTNALSTVGNSVGNSV